MCQTPTWFCERQGEWKAQILSLTSLSDGDKTEVRCYAQRFGAAYECYSAAQTHGACSSNGNLRKLITTGKPQPSPW